jgi:hypothetical protein
MRELTHAGYFELFGGNERFMWGEEQFSLCTVCSKRWLYQTHLYLLIHQIKPSISKLKRETLNEVTYWESGTSLLY